MAVRNADEGFIAQGSTMPFSRDCRSLVAPLAPLPEPLPFVLIAKLRKAFVVATLSPRSA